mmetsp:Transcript_75547/g.180497  ORF Transcript_75547/g.180497 Transcript_75547/m.180497 type:complete len:260 (+) Transcript_75547:65-844(+)
MQKTWREKHRLPQTVSALRLYDGRSSLLVAQHGASEPPLGVLDASLAASGCVGLDLVLIHLAHREVLGLRVGKDQRGHRGARHHHVALGELQLVVRQPVHVQQVPHGLLLPVVRLGGVARRRADALVLHLQHLLQRQLLIRRVAPQRGSDLQVDQLCKRLRQAVRHRLQQDRLVDFPLVLELLPLLMAANAAGAREGRNVVWAHLLGGNEVALAPISGLAHVQLLTQPVELAGHGVPVLVGVDLDVISNAVGRVDADDA